MIWLIIDVFWFSIAHSFPLASEEHYEGRKEMFYLTTYSTHFNYGYMAWHVVKDHSDRREETCCRRIGYSFWLAARVFYMHHPTDRIIHTTAFVTPVVEHDPSHHERTLLPWSFMGWTHWAISHSAGFLSHYLSGP